MTDLFENAKAGDPIVVTTRTRRCVTKIARVTKTQIIVAKRNGTIASHETRYRKRNGEVVGGDTWDIHYAKPATQDMIQEVRAENRRKHMIRMLSEKDWFVVPQRTLERVVELLEEKI